VSNEHNVNVSTEELSRIERIVADAFDRMNASASKVNSQAHAAAVAYKGSGTATVTDSYTNLGGAGKALGEALDGLLSDIGATSTIAHETDANAQQAAHQGAAQGPVIDMSIKAGM
jgi:uncharacterized protein YukE